MFPEAVTVDGEVEIAVQLARLGDVPKQKLGVAVEFLGSTNPFKDAEVTETLVAGAVAAPGGDPVTNELTLPYVVAHSLVVTTCQK
jgi:hypothetical protein